MIQVSKGHNLHLLCNGIYSEWKILIFEFPQNAKNVSRGTCDATYKQENV